MPLTVTNPAPLPHSQMRVVGPGWPARDRAYLAWRDARVEIANLRWLDSHFPGYPRRDLLDAWELDEALFLATGGNRMFWAESEIYHHRMRYLAYELFTNPRRMEALAHRYLATLSEVRRCP